MAKFFLFQSLRHLAPILAFLFGFSATDILARQSTLTEDLFTDNRLSLSRRQEIILDKLQNQPSVLDIRAVNVRYDLMEKDTINLNLFPGESISAIKSQIITRSKDNYTWIGEYSDSSGHLVLVAQGGGVTGTVRMDSVIYNIRDIGNGVNLIIRVFHELLEPECGLNSETLQQGQAPQNNRDPDDKNTLKVEPFNIGKILITTATTPLHRIYVAYTTNAKNAYGGDMPALIQDAVDETNTAYDRSEISLLVELAGTVEVSYDEVDIGTDLDRLVQPNDGYMDNIHSLRDQNLADEVVLITDYFSGYGAVGNAGGILAHPGVSFAIATWQYAVDYYTFAHEVGHLQGTRHYLDSNTNPFPHGHGYCYDGILLNFRTIMATSGDCSPDRIQNFSNPDVDHWWAATGDSSYSNSARVIGEQTATVLENYYGTDITVSDYTIPWGFPNSGDLSSIPPEQYVASNSITAGPDFTINANADVIFRSGSKTTLKPGFHAVAGSEFRAYIDPGLAASKAPTPPVVVDAPVIADAENDLIPTVYSLSHAYPNPFNPITTIRYGLPVASSVSLVVYDIMGREVARLVDGHLEPGYHAVVWNSKTIHGRDLPSGIYIARLVTPKYTKSIKMLLLK